MNTNWKSSVSSKAIKTITNSRNIWRKKFQDSQEELRKANISISIYKDLWQQAEKSVQELKVERYEQKQKGITFLRDIAKQENSK